MSKIRVLLAGESWSSTTTHTKGFDQFSTAEFQAGIGPHRLPWGFTAWEGYRRPWLQCFAWLAGRS